MGIRETLLVGGLAASTLLACARNDMRGVPPGYTLAPNAAAMPANTSDTNGPHTAVIQRTTDDATEARLLRVAESVYPPAEAVRRAAERGFAGARALPSGDSLWWYSEFDGVRLPYAVTGDAVRYYWQLHQAFEAGDSLAAGPIAMQRTSLRYEATVEPEASFTLNGESFDDVYVARLRLHWDNYCGNLCALTIDSERTMVLTEDGRVLAVDGDGVQPVAVS